MATLKGERFYSQADPELLAELRKIADEDGRDFQSVIEDAFRVYIRLHKHEGIRPEVAAHLKASIARHRRLYELLAQ